MKKIFLAVLTAVAIVSCSTDNEPQNEVPREKAFLNIGVKSSDGTRSTAANTATIPNDKTIKNFKAFVVDGDGSLKTGYSSDGEALTGGNKAITVSTRAKRVYVIANAGNITLADEAAILNYITDLNAPDGASQSAGRWATGSADLATTDFIQNQDGAWVASSVVPLVFIAARITVKIENNMQGYNVTSNDNFLKLEKVLVLNARGESKLFGTSLIPTYGDTYNGGKKFYEGMANPASPASPFFHYPKNGTFTVAASLLSDGIAENDFTSAYYYYVFESNTNKAEEFPTIVTIEGSYKGKKIYFPVHLASYEVFGGTTTFDEITRGNSYDITIKLSGDPGDGGDYPGGTGGTDDPTNPVVSSLIDVSIKLTDWTPIVLGKEFK